MSDEAVRHRFYAEPLAAGTVPLAEAEAHHALHVLRLKAGATVELFDGQGRRGVGSLVTEGRRRAHVEVQGVDGPQPSPRPAIRVSFAVPKAKRLDWLLEKCSELGASSLQPTSCARSVVEPSGSTSTTQRWRSVCVSAVRQSGRLWLPRLLPPASLADVLAAGPEGVGLMGDGSSSAVPLATALDGTIEAVHLLVGPEGGWTDEEREAAQAAGFRRVRLGWSTLRMETAAVALTAAVLALAETRS